MNNSKVKVVFIAGTGRCGSTVFDMLLGSLDGVCTVGELNYIWKRGIIENWLCGCGIPFRQCAFWCSVLEEAFGNTDAIRPRNLSQLADSLSLRRHLLGLAFGFSKYERYDENLKAYSQVLAKLYMAIRKVSACRVIVDASKHPAYGNLLNLIPNINVHIVHLIRDSRAVVYSWQRQKRLHVTGKVEYMSTVNPVRVALAWCLRNTAAHSLRKHNRSYCIVRYEDLVADPQEVVRRILENIGEESKDIQQLDERAIVLPVGHALSGNPVRIGKGRMEIQLDTEWKEKMRKSQKALVSFLTWSLLAKYGYLRSSIENSNNC